MHVFVTGGTGLIGSAVVAELLGNGHTVFALTRSDASALAAGAAGAETLRGGLADLNILRAGAAKADGVIHLAFGNDFSSAGAVAQAVAEASGGLAAPRGGVADSDRAVGALLPLASRGVRSTAVRMPRTVHNQGKGGFAGLLTQIARRTGVSGYPGDGAQRWPAVHALDAAVLFRLALELAPAGTSWHAVADEGDAVRDIAAVIGRRLGLPVEAVPQETYGPPRPLFPIDQPSASTPTRAPLGWEPTHPSLLEDLECLQP